MPNQFTFCPEFGANQIQNTTDYHSPYFQSQWWLHHVMGVLVIIKDWEFFRIKNEWNGAKHRQNPRGKPSSVCFPTDTGRQINLSAGQ